MTNHIDTQTLVVTLEDRIAKLNFRTPAGANELSRLLREINAGEYNAEPTTSDDTTTTTEDTLPSPERFVDKLIAERVPMRTLVADLPVGEVSSVRTILWRRRHEAEQQVMQLEKIRAVFDESVEGTIREDEPVAAEDEPVAAEDEPKHPAFGADTTGRTYR